MNLIRNKKAKVALTIFGLALAISFLRTDAARAKSAAEQDGASKPFVAEYYYKAKWGHATSSSRSSGKTTIPFSGKKSNLEESLKFAPFNRGFILPRMGGGTIA
jgi:hypothetical protein